MPTRTKLSQVVSYVDPSTKELAIKKITGNGHRMSMSAYIDGLMKKDLIKTKKCA